MKAEYIKIIDNDPTKKAMLLTVRISESEYEIVELVIPEGYRNEGIEDELLKEVTEDADNQGITLLVDINKMMAKFIDSIKVTLPTDSTEKNIKDEELEQFKRNLAEQKKRVDEKINPIKQLYDEGKITQREFVEKLADAFHELEEEN